MRVALAGVARGGRAVLGPVDLALAPGEVVAVLGPSGIGKTTLLRQVAGLDPAPPGGVTGAGRLAMVFQEPVLLPWRTALANVVLAAGCGEGEGRRWLTRVGLSGREDAYPRALSLGQQRRVALARAFAAAPETLLLDEPFVSLDRATAERMQALMADLLAERPVRALLVTHAAEEALALADRVVTLTGAPAAVTSEIALDRPRGARADADWRAAQLARLDGAAPE